jgi:signal transduction histidine kinase
LNRRLLLGYIGLALFVLAALEVPLGITYQRNERQDLTSKVEHDTVALSTIFEDALEQHVALGGAAAEARRYTTATGGRVVVVDSTGRAVLDTRPTREETGTSFANRPEIRAALGGRITSGERHSRTLGANLLYVAVPITSNGTIHGAVRVTYPTSAVDHRVRRYWLVLAAVAGIVLALATLIGLILARSVSQPLRELEAAAEAVGDGDLSARAPTTAGPPEVRSLAHVLNDTVAKLESLLRSQEAFVADASHQLRTPLTALRLRLENLRHDVAPAGQPGLESAEAEVERLARIVDGLLSLARADADTRPATTVDLAPLIAERIAAAAPLASTRRIKLHDAGAATPPVRAGAMRLEQAIDELLTNALRASADGSTIEVHARRADGWIEIHITDEGQGLSEEGRARAFDRFWRGRTEGEGSGLGLAIVRQLVALDGGEVELLANEPSGIDAVVRLLPAG